MTMSSSTQTKNKSKNQTKKIAKAHTTTNIKTMRKVEIAQTKKVNQTKGQGNL
jgi:hypothetical protein